MTKETAKPEEPSHNQLQEEPAEKSVPADVDLEDRLGEAITEGWYNE